MNAGELIHALAERTGYDTTPIKDLLANPALSQINLPDDFKPAVLNSLLTVNEAKINGDLKKHFAGVHLGSVDSIINEMTDEYALPDDVKGVLKNETSTFERIKLFTKSLAKLKEEAAAAVGGEKKTLVDQINKLNADIASAKDQLKAETARIASEWQGRFSDHLVNSKFTQYDYAMDTIPVDVQATSARTLFERKLSEKGGKMKFVDGKVTLVSATDDALPFTIDNKPVEFESFADAVVSENKLIKVKGATPPPSPTPTPTPTPLPTKIVVPAAKSQVSNALQDLRAGSQ